MDSASLSERAMQVRQLYTEHERARYGRAWTAPEVALGFVGDVGDLMKLVQARGGVRAVADVDQKLAHELADCLWSLLVLARLHEVDLERAFLETMDELEEHLRGLHAGSK